MTRSSPSRPSDQQDGGTGASLRDSQSRPYIGATHLELSDDEAAAPTQELCHIESDRYRVSPRIRTLRAILAKLDPPAPGPEPPPPLNAGAAPGLGRGRWRR